MGAHSPLRAALRKIAQAMPPGARLQAQVHDDHLWLEILELPVGARGTGTAWLAEILAAADKARLPTCLVADPTDRPGDPGTFELVRWYRRFGFQPLAWTEDGVAMERSAQPGSTPQGLAHQAHRARAADGSREAFEAWVAAQTAAAVAPARPVRAPRF